MAKRKKKRGKAGTSKAAADERKKLFIEAYITNGGNATQAAITAGYSEKSAGRLGNRLSKDVQVMSALKARQEDIQRKTGLTTERILQELANIAFADLRKCFSENGELLPPDKWPDDLAAAMAGVEVVEQAGGAQVDGDGIKHVPMFTKKVKLWDKNSAIEKAMKHLGLFEKDKDPPPPPVNVTVKLKPDEAYLALIGKK